MKTKIIFISIAVFLYIFSDVSAAGIETNKIIISEIQITGLTGHSDDDFVELYNPNAAPIDISDYRLRYRNSTGTENSLNKIKSGICIAAHGYYLWANSNGAFADIADTKTGTGLSSKYSLALLLPEGAPSPLVDSVSWENNHPFDESAYKFATSPTANKSMVRNVDTNDWLLDFSLIPTPTKSTSTLCPEPEPTPKVTYDMAVRLNEFLANPSLDEEENEFIELFNPSDTVVDLSLWILRDASASGKYVLPSGTKIQPRGFLVVYRSTFKFALNNSDETVSLLDPNGEEKDSVSYKTAKEDVSWNYTATGFRGGVPTPGTVNQPNNLPQTREKVPKKGYRGVAIDFDARGGDTDHDTLKYTWDFGDDHKSYKERTSHTYEKNGTYTVTLKTSDGKDDTEETFTIGIESYPHLEIRITSLLPNPDGADTGNEWLLIENREKKTVNLKGYSIATGWKNLTNHPIREDFLVKSGKEARLTHDFSLFTLPNQKGEIELRAPDGKALQSIRYKLDKPVAENAVYQKEKGSAWKWDQSTGKSSPSPEKETAVKKEAIPLVLGTSDTKQEETLQPTGEDISRENRATKSDQISLDPDRPLPQDILAYGTRVRLPNTITLVFLPSEETNTIPVSESSPLPSEESISSKINTALNGFLNATR